MSAGGWGCPHEVDGHCNKIRNLPCDPGMKGCELHGRYAFFDAGKNARFNEKRARADAAAPAKPAAAPETAVPAAPAADSE